MREIFCSSGNTYFLVNIDYNEAYSFNRFGESISQVSPIMAMSNSSFILDVNLISILGDANEYCEVYFKGMVAVVNRSAIELYSELSGMLKRVSGLVFRVKHDTLVSHIIIPIEKDSITWEELYKATGYASLRKLSM